MAFLIICIPILNHLSLFAILIYFDFWMRLQAAWRHRSHLHIFPSSTFLLG
jgi:hypothetical protein